MENLVWMVRWLQGERSLLLKARLPVLKEVDFKTSPLRLNASLRKLKKVWNSKKLLWGQVAKHWRGRLFFECEIAAGQGLSRVEGQSQKRRAAESQDYVSQHLVTCQVFKALVGVHFFEFIRARNENLFCVCSPDGHQWIRYALERRQRWSKKTCGFQSPNWFCRNMQDFVFTFTFAVVWWLCGLTSCKGTSYWSNWWCGYPHKNTMLSTNKILRGSSHFMQEDTWIFFWPRTFHERILFRQVVLDG